MPSIIDIEGITEVYATKLKAAGVATTDTLLEKGATPKGRSALEETTGISHELMLKWVNMADLYRIKGIGAEYSRLLEVSGVDTVPELSHRNAENLLAKMTEVNTEKHLVHVLPTLHHVESWIAQAKELPRAINY